MTIHQIIVGARAGDAITQLALNTRRILRGFGESEVFARFVDPSISDQILDLAAFPRLTPSDYVIWHASIGDQLVGAVLESTAAQVVISYHNISPPELFQHHDVAFADMLRAGRQALRRIRPRVVATYTESEFNAQDIRTEGYEQVTVIRPLLELRRFDETPGDVRFARSIRDRIAGRMILSIGQLLPHKHPELLISAHHLLTAGHDPNLTLVLAGPQPLPEFVRQLASWARSLGLPRVWFTGAVTEPQVGELYRAADVLVSASEHEGFGIPLLEAMATGTPIVTTLGGAIAETLGGAGIQVDPPSATSISEAVALALEPAVAEELVAAGRVRLKHFAPERAELQTTEFFMALLRQ